MNFKEWLKINEIRNKGLYRMFSAEHPKMPKYVRDDLYTSRIAYSLKNGMNTSTKNRNTTVTSASDIFKVSGLKGIKWTKRPVFLRGNFGKISGITPYDFDKDTQWRMLNRRFGMREEKQIRNDAARTAKQKELMQQRGDSNEPVIVLMTLKGYKLLEGWHRTMNYLLKGAPPDQLESLKNGNLKDIDFYKWHPVQVQGYVGEDEAYQTSNVGTGHYEPSDSTGNYVPELEIENLAKEINLDISKFDPQQIINGLNVEEEHNGKMGKDVDVVRSRADLLKIVIAHLREDPEYYIKLKNMQL
jgi:hypothetical protein